MKSKSFRIIIDLLVVILGIVFLVFGIKDTIKSFSQPTIEDNIKFSKSYTNVPTNNIYKYVESIDEIEDENNTVIFVGNPKDEWSQVLACVLFDVLNDKYNIIYYLEEYDSSIPNLIILKNGKQSIYKKNDLIEPNYKEAPIDYWTDERKLNLLKLFD